MVFALTYLRPGRGSFPDSGLGGTLNSSGTGPGGYYRAPAIGSTAKMPGLECALALRNQTSCSINAYGVNAAVKAIQRAFGMNGSAVDGVFGKDTAAVTRTYQLAKKITVDGAVGPQTTKTLCTAMVVNAAAVTDSEHWEMLKAITLGTMAVESAFDLGAVGLNEKTPEDVGVAQINGVHSLDPDDEQYISLDDRLNPVTAIPWMVRFIDNNLKVMDYDLDASILAYNLGLGGTRSWMRAGRPDIWNGVNVRKYITKIQAAA